jgi:hypothetical protein
MWLEVEPNAGFSSASAACSSSSSSSDVTRYALGLAGFSCSTGSFEGKTSADRLPILLAHLLGSSDIPQALLFWFGLFAFYRYSSNYSGIDSSASDDTGPSASAPGSFSQRP